MAYVKFTLKCITEIIPDNFMHFYLKNSDYRHGFTHIRSFLLWRQTVSTYIQLYNIK